MPEISAQLLRSAIDGVDYAIASLNDEIYEVENEHEVINPGDLDVMQDMLDEYRQTHDELLKLLED